jgi:hypothetical protein
MQMAVKRTNKEKASEKLLVKELLSFVTLTELKKWFVMLGIMPFPFI